jgi:hypothetical protein
MRRIQAVWLTRVTVSLPLLTSGSGHSLVSLRVVVFLSIRRTICARSDGFRHECDMGQQSRRYDESV